MQRSFDRTLRLRGHKTRSLVGPAFRAVCDFNRVKIRTVIIGYPVNCLLYVMMIPVAWLLLCYVYK